MTLRIAIAVLWALVPVALVSVVTYRTDVCADSPREAWAIMGWFAAVALLRVRRLHLVVTLGLHALPLAVVLSRAMTGARVPAEESLVARAFGATWSASHACMELTLVTLGMVGLAALPHHHAARVVFRRPSVMDAAVVLAVGCAVIVGKVEFRSLMALATIACCVGLSSRGTVARRAGLIATLLVALLTIVEAQERSLSTIGLGWGPPPWTGGEGRHLSLNPISVLVVTIIVFAALVPRPSSNPSEWLWALAVPLFVAGSTVAATGMLRAAIIERAAPGWLRLQQLAPELPVTTACDEVPLEGGDIYLLDDKKVHRLTRGSAEQPTIVALAGAEIDGLLAWATDGVGAARLLTRGPGPTLRWGGAPLRACLVGLGDRPSDARKGCVVADARQLLCSANGQTLRWTVSSAHWPAGAAVTSGPSGVVVLLPPKSRVDDSLALALEASAALGLPQKWSFMGLGSLATLEQLHEAVAKPTDLSIDFADQDHAVTAMHRGRIRAALQACRDEMPSESSFRVWATPTGFVAFDEDGFTNACLREKLPNPGGMGPAAALVRVHWRR